MVENESSGWDLHRREGHETKKSPGRREPPSSFNLCFPASLVDPSPGRETAKWRVGARSGNRRYPDEEEYLFLCRLDPPEIPRGSRV